VKILPVQYSFSDYYKTGGDELHADTLFPGGVLLVSLDPSLHGELYDHLRPGHQAGQGRVHRAGTLSVAKALWP